MRSPTSAFADLERRALHGQLACYSARRRRLALEGQSTPWLDRKLDDLLDRLLELRQR